MNGYPPFVLGKSRFNSETFWGRSRHFLDVVDPRTLFTSDKKLYECKKLLDDYRTGEVSPDVTDQSLWEAQKVVQAILHPDTGKKIFIPFRMSGFVPFGTPIAIGILIPNQSLMAVVFWQWLNQSHNACVNYANRNASRPTPTIKFVQGYAAAVTSAVGIAGSLNVLVHRAQTMPPVTRVIIQRFIPLPAVAAASTANLLLMRMHEASEGIEVVDSHGNVVGVSKMAAKKALFQTSLTRAVLPAPIVLIPLVVMTLLDKTAIFRRYPRLNLPVHSLVILTSFGLALPLAISLFPQTGQIQQSVLEPEIRENCSEDVLFYNKGL